jgi:hypothetical protein
MKRKDNGNDNDSDSDSDNKKIKIDSLIKRDKQKIGTTDTKKEYYYDPLNLAEVVFLGIPDLRRYIFSFMKEKNKYINVRNPCSKYYISPTDI